ncbi:MAG: division/cell wall cluster transcriptional repressor MraZ [Candidatus Omnitrophica bacterium]|nr:division/cell wall cluster transcriptional repressor MraZ [Candidatus Omnitrophota bacterium]
MFYGEYHHHIDRKGRLIIPSKLREVAKEHYAERFFVTRGLDRCLFVFTEDEWRMQENKWKNLPYTRSEVRKFNRIFFSGAADVHCDIQGRILIPGYLKEYALIKREVVLIGVSNRIELWGREQWNEYYQGSKDSYEEIAENLMDEGKGA